MTGDTVGHEVGRHFRQRVLALRAWTGAGNGWPRPKTCSPDAARPRSPSAAGSPTSGPS
jgi:hypothetical protein